MARQHVEAGHDRKQVERFGRPAMRWGDTQLEASQAASHEAAKKRASGIEIVTEIEALLGTVVVDEWDLEAIENGCAPHGDACGGPRRWNNV